MTAYEQRSYPGSAADTVLTADITNVGTAFSVTAGTGSGYPDGSGGPFFVIIDYDNSKAEKVRCSGRVNDTFTVAGTGGGRGQDGTSAVAHTAPAKVRAVWTATDAQEANRAAANTIGKVTTKGDLLTGSGANTLARTAAGADGTIPIFDSTQPGGVRAGANPALVGTTLDATSTVGGVSGTSLAADRTAWADYSGSVTLPGTGATIGNGALYARYKQVGKTVNVDVRVTGGSTSTWGGSNAQIGGLYPVAPHTSGGNDDATLGIRFTQSTNGSAWAIAVYNGTVHTIYLNGLTTAETGGFNGFVYRFRFSYEAA